MRALIRFCCILIAFIGCTGPPRGGEAVRTSNRRARPEQYYVTEAALRYELGKHSSLEGECERYSGYVLDCGEFTNDLVGALTGYTPPFTPDAMMADNGGGDLVDRATGKHIKLWRVTIEELHRNVAKAYVFWICAGFRFGDGSYTLMLRRNGGCWQVTSERDGCTL
jgi:hypothetical protein